MGAVVFFFVGIVFWGGFNTAMEMTNTLKFCISCHEMEQTVYREYTETKHYSNRTGVRAVCADCHVPKEWLYKVKRKIQATNELYHKVMGTVSTLEKFEERRLEMANRVWAVMKATDSRECRNCHSWNAMLADVQKPTAVRRHRKGRDKGETCIDCHKGIAHKDISELYDPEAAGS